MPRRKQPLSLEQLTLRTLAENALQACKRSRGQHEDEIVGEYVCSIPNLFANDYVAEVLRLCSMLEEDFNIASAFHDKCTKIMRNGHLSLSANWYCRLISSLHVMRDLQVLHDVSNDDESIDIGKFLPFPKLNKLVSIQIPRTFCHHLVTTIVENCPLLEKIDSGQINVYCCLAKPDFSDLGICNHLIKIRTTPLINSSCGIVLLEKLPRLEILELHDVQDVLALCEHPYLCLKDFFAPLHAKKSEILEKVATYFPNLESLNLNLNGVADLSPVKKLTKLKSLKLKLGSASSLLCLLDNCMNQLSSLTLCILDGLDSIFIPEKNVSFPQIHSLVLYSCSGVNLAAIGEIFPSLKSFEAQVNDFTQLHQYPTPRAFQEIQSFVVDNTMPQKYVRHIISSNQLRNLHLKNGAATVSYGYNRFFQDITLEALQTLTVDDDLMTREVIPVILGLNSPRLKYVLLIGKRLILSKRQCEILWNQLKLYDMSLVIRGSRTKFKYV